MCTAVRNVYSSNISRALARLQALLLDGYNREVAIRRNTFYLIGGSAVVLWGHETNGDGTDGTTSTTVSVGRCTC